VENKKICGILCENFIHNTYQYAVLGMGINVNSTLEDLLVIDQPATSIFKELNFSVSREELLKNLLNNIISSFESLVKNGFSVFRERISARLAYLNEYKSVTEGSDKYKAKILDINEDGLLIVECENGENKKLLSAEISFSDI
jgi:BirA family biotin operon repressor/biotin-[acetyl-CoA-carboxylase] ligase